MTFSSICRGQLQWSRSGPTRSAEPGSPERGQPEIGHDTGNRSTHGNLIDGDKRLGLFTKMGPLSCASFSVLAQRQFSGARSAHKHEPENGYVTCLSAILHTWSAWRWRPRPLGLLAPSWRKENLTHNIDFARQSNWCSTECVCNLSDNDQCSRNRNTPRSCQAIQPANVIGTGPRIGPSPGFLEPSAA